MEICNVMLRLQMSRFKKQDMSKARACFLLPLRPTTYHFWTIMHQEAQWHSLKLNHKRWVDLANREDQVELRPALMSKFKLQMRVQLFKGMSIPHLAGSMEDMILTSMKHRTKNRTGSTTIAILSGTKIHKEIPIKLNNRQLWNWFQSLELQSNIGVKVCSNRIKTNSLATLKISSCSVTSTQAQKTSYSLLHCQRHTIIMPSKSGAMNQLLRTNQANLLRDKLETSSRSLTLKPDHLIKVVNLSIQPHRLRD